MLWYIWGQCLLNSVMSNLSLSVRQTCSSSLLPTDNISVGWRSKIDECEVYYTWPGSSWRHCVKLGHIVPYEEGYTWHCPPCCPQFSSSHACFPRRCSSSLGEDWGIGIRSFLFSLMRPMGKGSPLLGLCDTSNPIFPWLCARVISLLLLSCVQTQGMGAARNQDFGNQLLTGPRAGPSCPLQHPHTWTWSLTTLLGL